VGSTTRTGVVDTELGVSARVRHAGGDAYGGATVTWVIETGGGSITSSAATTSDPTGHTAAVWRLGTSAGAQRAVASIQTRGRTDTVVFEATAEPGPAIRVELTADTLLLSARGKTAFLSPSGYDAFDNPTGAEGAFFASTDDAVASVSTDELVTGGEAGSARVRLALDDPMDSVEVTVVYRGAITVIYDDGWRPKPGRASGVPTPSPASGRGLGRREGDSPRLTPSPTAPAGSALRACRGRGAKRAWRGACRRASSHLAPSCRSSTRSLRRAGRNPHATARGVPAGA